MEWNWLMLQSQIEAMTDEERKLPVMIKQDSQRLCVIAIDFEGDLGEGDTGPVLISYS